MHRFRVEFWGEDAAAEFVDQAAEEMAEDGWALDTSDMEGGVVTITGEDATEQRIVRLIARYSGGLKAIDAA